MLDRQVLVLNRLWQAINVCTVRRAFTLLCQGHAQVVYSDGQNNFLTHDFESWRDFSTREPEDEMVHTISFKIRVPRVIVLLLFDRMPRKEVKFTRHNIFRARQEHLPVLRRRLREARPQSRSRRPAGQRRRDDLGKHCLLLHRLQHAQGQPPAASGRDAFD
jgi:hypothetical protein